MLAGHTIMEAERGEAIFIVFKENFLVIDEIQKLLS